MERLATRLLMFGIAFDVVFFMGAMWVLEFQNPGSVADIIGFGAAALIISLASKVVLWHRMSQPA